MPRRPLLVLLAALTVSACSTAAPTDEVLDSAEVPPVVLGGIERLVASIQYPDFEQRAGVEGDVVIGCIVRQNGLATDVEVLRSVSPGLDRGAVQAVQRQRFEPGRQNGRAVAVRFSLTLPFRLPEPPAPRAPR